MSEQYDLLKSILLEKSVRTGTFTLASGKVSDLYVDCRMTALDPVGATLVGALGWKLVQEEILPRFPEVAAIGGMTMGAAVSYTHLRAHETRHDLVCRLLLEKKKKKKRPT